jgi:hypothetical protein
VYVGLAGVLCLEKDEEEKGENTKKWEREKKVDDNLKAEAT